jgi:hypothetical protein
MGHAFEETQDGIGDFAAMRFEREVPVVIKVHLGLRDISLERFAAGV